jgi:hypothetical protein
MTLGSLVGLENVAVLQQEAWKSLIVLFKWRSPGRLKME